MSETPTILEDPTKVDLSFDPREQRMTGWTYHGNHRIDVPFISHVAGNLWQGGCTTGLVLPEDIVHVISLYKWEAYTYHPGVRSVETILAYDADGVDLGGMGVDGVLQLAGKVNEKCEDGPTLVHCQAGLNRSGLVAATALCLSGQVANGREAVDLLRQKRGSAVLCNASFEAWLLEYFA